MLTKQHLIYNSVTQSFQDTDYFQTSINFHGLKVDQKYENNTNTSFSKVGLWPTFTNFNENHVSVCFQSLSK